MTEEHDLIIRRHWINARSEGRCSQPGAPRDGVAERDATNRTLFGKGIELVLYIFSRTLID